MQEWSFRNLATIALGVFVALSLSASVALAGSMPMPMSQTSMMPDMEMSEHRGCDACEAGEEMLLSCPAACSMPSAGLLPELVHVALAASSHRLPLPRAALLRGTTPPPIPLPPRTSYIG